MSALETHNARVKKGFKLVEYDSKILCRSAFQC